MARYVARIQTPRSAKAAFLYMADLRNFAEWDPGVTGVTQVVGDGPDSNAAFDVTVKSVPAPLTLRYETVTYRPSELVVARAESSRLVSLDTITVEPINSGESVEGGAIVTYDAELSLKGALAVFDPAFRLVFNRIGDRAAAGLVRVLEGTSLT